MVYHLARVVGEALGRKPPNKVRIGGRDEGGGGVMHMDDGKSANSLL